MREITEIYEDMLAVFEEKTGFRMEDTADLAVRLYAAAAQIQSLYIYADWALNQSFPQTATGEYLDYHGQLRGISRKDGQKAKGILRFKIDAAREDDLPVPAGTVCTTAGLVRFMTTQEGLITAGSLFTDVQAEAELAGPAGNAEAERVTQMTKAPIGVTGVTNPAAFQGGTDGESDEQLRARILDSFIRLPNGANAAFYELRVLSHEGVAAVRVIPRYAGIGTVGVVVAAADGQKNPQMLQQIREDLEAVREIAVDVIVLEPEWRLVDVTAEIKPKTGYAFADAAAAVRTALQSYFSSELLGKTVYRAALGNVIYETGVVENYTLRAPTEDLEGSDTVLPRLGTVTLTEGL